MYKSCSAAQELSKKRRIRNRDMAKGKPSASEVRQTRISEKDFLQFLDILLIRQESRCASSNNFNIVYTGNRSPRTKAEEIYSSLYHYITKTNQARGSTSLV